MNTTTTEPVTRVVFRMWRNESGVVALFPDLLHSHTGPYIISYERIGQHGAADYSGVMLLTRAATPDEYRDLHAELTRIGYKLRPVRRR